nr:hypothetical protein [Clostridioides sp.]
MNKVTVAVIFKMFLGFFIFAISSVLMINGNIGLMAWDVFHQGVSQTLGITIGQAAISVGLIIIIIDVFLGENIGWGTVCNMIFIGLFMDLIIYVDIIPKAENIYIGIIMNLVSIVLAAFASFLYLGAYLGSGPRDGLMLGIHKKTKISVRMIRTLIEVGALFIGWLLGGTVGVGTFLSAFTLGYVLQLIFKIFEFDTQSIEHRPIVTDVRYLKNKFGNKVDYKSEEESNKEVEV